MIAVRFGHVVVVVVVAVGAGCTSFAFKQSGKGTAPAELMEAADMVALDGGVFQMGNKIGEPDEVPQHKVTIAPFLLDKTEVTLGNYSRCVDARVCRALAPIDEEWATTELHPVVGVTWYDAKKYCEWVGKRLPTEAEWEFAARKTGTVYPWDGPWKQEKANSRSEKDGFPRTAPVGSFPAGISVTGVLDLAGNAAEWTADWYDPVYYQKSTETDPKGPEASTGSKAVRGGSWADPDHLLRATARLGVDPNVSNTGVGFRCAR